MKVEVLVETVLIAVLGVCGARLAIEAEHCVRRLIPSATLLRPIRGYFSVP